ncbi:MAG TPA: 4'-phosphopantetheinyl transferase superfamily protein [bacterium]
MPETVAESVLVGVGVDAEDVRRFAKIAAGAPRWRLVFTEREAEHLAAQPRPALAFCAAFCAKEAVCKALGERYPFVECECRFPGGGRSLEVIAAPALLESRGIAGIRVHLREHYPDERGECVVEAYLYRGAPEGAEALPAARSRLKSLAVAAAARGRAQIEARHFSPAELADLGERSVQSVAGFLALKSALVVLWADAGAPLPVPRDFELRHQPGGAPVVVSAPPGPGGVHVSISHTRAWAYGLAALCPA